MAQNSAVGKSDFEELKSRLDWIDNERRKTNRRLVEQEQRLVSWERDLESREQRLEELETKMASTLSQLARVSQIDAQLRLFKDEIVKLVEQSDQRRVSSQEEIEKLRRIEQEHRQREISDIRKELVVIDRIQTRIESHEAEQARLVSLITGLQTKVGEVHNDFETQSQMIKFIEESERNNAKFVSEVDKNLVGLSKRIEPTEVRVDVVSHNQTKIQGALQEIEGAVSSLNDKLKSWTDQVQVGEYERNKKVSEWKEIIEGYDSQIDRFSTEWVKFADQYKAAKQALDVLETWKEQEEQKRREASEVSRIEANQIRSKWENFVLEHDKKWKNAEIDREQRWAGAQRQHRQLVEQIDALQTTVKEIQQDKDTLWRIQSAQADAIKKLPRVWLEEVEKAIAHNPNSRRQPALVPVREE